MNVNGIGGIGSNWPGIQPGQPRRPQEANQGQAPAPTRPQQEAAAAQAQQGSLPVDAPRGTDPQLWSVLTSEERTFFARARAMGPLTYGPGSQGGPAGPARGGRVDIRI